VAAGGGRRTGRRAGRSDGLLSTILGFGKDALARRYLHLSSQRHVPSLDLSALLAATES
jgi:hypothetical protein